jgi:predicted glycogen debranching enzyme
MHDNGLIYAYDENRPLTWMNRVVDNKAVTQRPGYTNDVNALWYNAICFMLELAEKAKKTAGLDEWKDIAARIPKSFTEIFWNDERKYLCDYSFGQFKDWSVRPNQVFAASLPYSPLTEDKRKLVLDKVKSELLTTRGLRSLAPKNPAYIGVYVGNQSNRDKAAFQGTVYPWLVAHFAEAYLKIHENSGLPFIKGVYKQFEEIITEHGIGSISEYYDGDPPHRPGGAISMAWNVAELLRFSMIINQFEANNKPKKDKK